MRPSLGKWDLLLSFDQPLNKSLSEASDWYNSEDSVLRDRFVIAVDERVSVIIERPLTFPVVEGTKIRRAVVGGFPYSIFFLLDGNHSYPLDISRKPQSDNMARQNRLADSNAIASF